MHKPLNVPLGHVYAQVQFLYCLFSLSLSVSFDPEIINPSFAAPSTGLSVWSDKRWSSGAD